jgi:hypothetical protein
MWAEKFSRERAGRLNTSYAAERIDGEYPRLVVSFLIAAKRAGMRFEDAWRDAINLYPPGEHGYGAGYYASGRVESPLMFFQRHAEAAYNGVQASAYCADEDCTALAERGAYCDDHASEQAA